MRYKHASKAKTKHASMKNNLVAIIDTSLPYNKVSKSDHLGNITQWRSATKIAYYALLTKYPEFDKVVEEIFYDVAHLFEYLKLLKKLLKMFQD